MGGRPKKELVLSNAEHEQLIALTLRRKTAQAMALRARIVLGCADGLRPPQDARDQELVCAPSEVPCALHVHNGILAPSGGTLVCHPDHAIHSPRHPPLDASTRAGNQTLSGYQQRQSQALPVAKSVDEILAGIERVCLRTSNSAHQPKDGLL